MSTPNRITVMRDAQLIAHALERAEAGSVRHEFILRLRRSFRTFGSLTPAMREALVSDSNNAVARRYRITVISSGARRRGR